MKYHQYIEYGWCLTQYWLSIGGNFGKISIILVKYQFGGEKIKHGATHGAVEEVYKKIGDILTIYQI